ncbi:MAG: polyprenyl synthetase family protein [bacterium]
MSNERFSQFIFELKKRATKIERIIFNEGFHNKFSPNHLNIAVYSYFKQGGKSLRPCLLLFACGAVGGDEEMALPAASAIEAYHTWTLVHDDIIDRDDRRRGGPTVHTEFTDIAKKELGFSDELAKHYGISMGILAGDIQHSWAISLLCGLKENGVKEELIINLIYDLESNVLPSLLEGETLDIQYSFVPLSKLTEGAILRVLFKKTGVLYGYAGRTGAIIGGGKKDEISAISGFCSRCGLAFQLVDDLLGLVGSEEALGKPIGSDIREGKKTIPIFHTYRNASKDDRLFIDEILSNRDVGHSDIIKLLDIVKKYDGINYTYNLASRLVERAKLKLKTLNESRYKDYLNLFADFIIERNY